MSRGDPTNPADPLIQRCWAVDATGRPPDRLRGTVVSWHYADPAEGAWVLWDGDEQRKPRWEPREAIALTAGGVSGATG